MWFVMNRIKLLEKIEIVIQICVKWWLYEKNDKNYSFQGDDNNGDNYYDDFECEK